MNLSDNLKKIRKENNLTQEDLAEKLGVSRQSVSKWESNQAYPEMDKVVQICKMFNLNMDDLLNQDIKEVNNIKQQRNNINKYIDSFLSYVTKTVNMFSKMKFSSKVKCMVEQLVIIGILCILFAIIGSISSSLISSVLSFMNYNKVYNIIYSILKSIYLIIAFVLGFIVVLHIFKERYLNYYDLSKEEKIEDEIELVKKDDEKIIIRDPKNSEYRIIGGLVKVFVLGLKIFLSFIAGFFFVSLVMLSVAFILSFLFIKSGILFVGMILTILASIVINYVILKMLFDFVFSHKSKKLRLALMFFISLLVMGFGIGMSLIGISKFKIINSNNDKYFSETEEIIDMNDKLEIYGDYEFVESDNDDIKIVSKTSKYYYILVENHEPNIYQIHRYVKDSNDIMNIINNSIKNVNNKEIILYDDYKIKIYTNRENIEKLKNNIRTYDEY